LYGGINKDPFTWKSQTNLDRALRVNKQGMLELVIDISDATLKGTDQSIERLQEVISRFKL